MCRFTGNGPNEGARCAHSCEFNQNPHELTRNPRGGADSQHVQKRSAAIHRGYAM